MLKMSCGRRIGALVEHSEVCSEVQIYPRALTAKEPSIMISLAARNQTRLTNNA